MINVSSSAVLQEVKVAVAVMWWLVRIYVQSHVAKSRIPMESTVLQNCHGCWWPGSLCCVLYMWGKIIIPMHRLWLRGLFVPWCTREDINVLNLITHSLTGWGWVGLWGFLWWAPSAKRKDHHGVSSGWSSVWHRSNIGLSSTQYEQIPIILGVWPFWLTAFFFRSITFWRAYG